jgi:hypothetical protein
MDMSKILYKSFSFKVDGLDEKGLIRGYASTFGNIDYGLDVVDKGAFKKSIKENKGIFPILADHNPDQQIGWNKRAEEDDAGLWVEGILNLEVVKAREKYALTKDALEMGAKMGLSIGYMTVKSEPDRESPMVRRLKELKLFEYSIVTFPMNVEAMITSAKNQGNIDKARLLIQECTKAGIGREEFEEALQFEAAKNQFDPSTLGQSIDDLIALIKN